MVGGGPVAARKVELLQQAGGRVHVVAPRLCESLAAQSARGELRATCRPYHSDDLSGVGIVVAATDRSDVNACVAADAAERGIAVNVVDSPALCTFIMPAIVDRSPVLVAISTAGASPVLARLVRSRVEAALPTQLGRLATFAARHRDAVKARFAPARRRVFWEMLLQGAVADLVLAGRDEDAEAALFALLREATAAGLGSIALIAVGDGDPERQSLGAARWLGGADLVLHAADARGTVRALARRDAECVEMRALTDCVELLRERVTVGQRVCVVRAGDVQGAGCHELNADKGLLDELGLPFVTFRAAP